MSFILMGTGLLTFLSMIYALSVVERTHFAVPIFLVGMLVGIYVFMWSWAKMEDDVQKPGKKPCCEMTGHNTNCKVRKRREAGK